jgi:hypothetical protein
MTNTNTGNFKLNNFFIGNRTLHNSELFDINLLTNITKPKKTTNNNNNKKKSKTKTKSPVYLNELKNESTALKNDAKTTHGLPC